MHDCCTGDITPLPGAPPSQDYDTFRHCIVSPQLWMVIYHIQTGPLTLRWWCHSIYAAWSSTIHGILALMHHYLPQYVWFASIHPICFCLSWPPTDHIISSFPQSLGEHTYVSWPQPNMQPPIISEQRCEIRRKSKTNEVLKGDKVPLVFKGMIWFSLKYPPIWFSMLKYKKDTLILLEGNSRSINSRKLCLFLETLGDQYSNNPPWSDHQL